MKKIDHLIDLIFEREYYTNHGPELKKLESNLEELNPGFEFLGLANFSIAFMISLLAMHRKGKVLIPSILDSEIIQALKFKNLDYRVCNVDYKYGLIDIKRNDLSGIRTIVINNTLGASHKLEKIIKAINNKEINLIIINKCGFIQNPKIKSDNKTVICEIFDFNFSTFNNESYGSIVAINNKQISEKIRNIRSSYGARKKIKIPYTGNGRMSEMQAGLINISLLQYQDKCRKIQKKHKFFIDLLKRIKNVEIIEYPDKNFNISFNHMLIFKILKKSNKFDNLIKGNQKYIMSAENIELIADYKDENAYLFLKINMYYFLMKFLMISLLII